MRPLRQRILASAIALAVGALTWSVLGQRAEADELDPAIAIEAWFSQFKEPAPVIDTPSGPISPGDPPPPPGTIDGGYNVVFGPSPDAPTGGLAETGWAAFQWDLLLVDFGSVVDQFVVTFTQSPDNVGDSNAGGQDGDGKPIAAPMRACNITATWGGAATANPWEDRPPEVDCKNAVAPDVDVVAGNTTYTFDLTTFAQTWLDGEGFGVVLRPGTAKSGEKPSQPVQITLAGYGATGDNAAQIAPSVTFRFTSQAPAPVTGGVAPPPAPEPAPQIDPGAGFAPVPDIDPIPNDVGSSSDATTPSTQPAGRDLAAPPTAPISAGPDTGFPLWPAFFTLALAAVAFWGTGTALGPAGEPGGTRQGGVGRILIERQAARAAGDLPPIRTTIED